MARKDSSPHIAALQEMEAALDEHQRTRVPAGVSRRARVWRGLRRLGLRMAYGLSRLDPFILFSREHPILRRAAIAAAVVLTVIFTAGGLLWWRLLSGPIALDLATPWLTSAVEQNFGNRYRIEVGGTVLERDAQGRTALRLRDIVLRDTTGASVAVASKADIGISGASLLTGSPRVESFRLVDANMTVRIDPDGKINVILGGERPFSTIAPTPDAAPQAMTAPSAASPRAETRSVPAAPPKPGDFTLKTMAERGLAANFTDLVQWVDRLGVFGLDSEKGGFDGNALTDIGIANGSLSIDDRRDGHEWKLSEITLNLSRPKSGGAVLAVLSDNKERPWALSAALTPGLQGNRRFQFEARKVLLDDLLALRMAEMRLRSDTLISASIDSEISRDGTPQTVSGSVLAQGGSIGDPAEPEHQIPITTAEFGVDWDITRRTLRVPFKVTAGAARYTLRSEFAAPAQPGGAWPFAIGGGWVVLDPLTPDDDPFVLKRVVIRGNIDPNLQRITLEHGDLGTKELGGGQNDGVTVAVSGKLDYAGEPRFAIGLAGTPMSAQALKRLWPSILAPKVRDWVVEHVVSGTVDRVDIAANAPVSVFRPGTPPLPEEALSIEMAGSGITLRPVAGLPAIRDADLNVRVNGRSAKVTLGKGTIDVSPGRRLTMSSGVFEVPNIRTPSPPARVGFRMEGSVPAAAELLALDRLREFSGAPFDPAATRGTLTAQIQLGLPLRPDLPPGSTDYDITVDLANFSADKMVFGQKAEAQALHVTANNQSYEIKGDMRVAGAPGYVEYRKLKGEPDAEVRLQATLDEGARSRLGMDLGNALSGALPMRLTGRVGQDDQGGRYNVEADLTATKIDNLLPGWVKPPGKQARLAFTLTRNNGAMRFDDLLIDGQGVLAKGSLELDGNGDLQSANLPVFATSDGDKASVKVDRSADGALRVVVRGDVFDGRNFIKTAMAGPSDPKAKARYPDLDLDVKLGVIAGHYGETVRGLDWRMSRRGGRVRTFTLNAKIGRDTPLIGEMRTRVANGRPVIYFETNDAGALFRFVDVYPRMIGGRMWIGMDPPSQDAAPQEGIINVSSFAIRGEGALDRVVAGQQNGIQHPDNIEFGQARADFTRTSGRMIIRDGVLKGPVLGATVEGAIDYARDQVNVRGTLVPLYGLNNMFGQIPVIGTLLGGGSNEGIFGITYEVTGPTANPRPMVNPISAIAPGILRKFFDFREMPDRDRAFAEPSMR
ncbi:AsmA-like C-terminal region-containing protein [Rhodoplanes sp. Z2-YC6860]|uniref:AsmA-like C-terminal region-containing protein n=1 Tax=Rhodoplanes sp. Z2-YC6860 TaxID=674703 RepID=UPI00078E1412|nr:AsmA-like C-terminal region-containing protein [Rhodoplanes sp. Z2-YC6860]AMN42786.1 RNA-binding region RNP-1 protein [Rhodoplanes sp. Z2-YC6860]